MYQKRVLYADNDPDYLAGRSEFLEMAGYHVIKASNPNEAIQALERENIHLAILDIRLIDDNDGGDASGIQLAKDERYKRVPKIFVTGYPTFAAVREAYGSTIGDQPIAHAFLAKDEGPDALVDALGSAFEKVVGINQELQIEWDEMNTLSFPYLTLLIDSGLEPTLLKARCDELADVFRKLFAKEEQISIARLNWVRNDCACLSIFTHKNDVSRQMVLIFGIWDAVQRQSIQLNRYLEVESTLYTKSSLAESLHYAAFAWVIPQVGVNPLQTGPAFFENSGDRMLRTALENLYQHNLSKWHQHERAEIHSTDLAELYRDRLEILILPDAMKKVRLNLEAIWDRAQSQSVVKEIFFEEAEMGVILHGGQTYRGPDPLAALFDPYTFKKRPTTVTSTFGGITSRALLVDQDGSVYPTDFFDMTRSPVQEDFISLECEFRFDRISSTNMSSLLDFEKQLAEINTLTGIPVGISVEPECRRALAATQMIRKLAAESGEEAFEAYLIGLFHYAMKGLLVYNPQNPTPKYQTVRVIHRLIAASMSITQIKRILEGNGDSALYAGAEQGLGLVIDQKGHKVTLDGREIHLTQTEFKLLSYLHERKGSLCKREDILATVFEIKDKPSDSDKSLLNTHVDRLRGKIDLNPAKHKYIVNIRGEGYRLDLDS